MYKDSTDVWIHTSECRGFVKEGNTFKQWIWVIFRHSIYSENLSKECLRILCMSSDDGTKIFSTMILDTIKEGRIVPSEVTVKLIKKTIESSDNYKFLIDGFPRSEENRIAFEHIVSFFPLSHWVSCNFSHYDVFPDFKINLELRSQMLQLF